MLGLYWGVILGLYWGSIREILRLYWGYIGVMLGFRVLQQGSSDILPSCVCRAQGFRV